MIEIAKSHISLRNWTLRPSGSCHKVQELTPERFWERSDKLFCPSVSVVFPRYSPRQKVMTSYCRSTNLRPIRIDWDPLFLMAISSKHDFESDFDIWRCPEKSGHFTFSCFTGRQSVWTKIILAPIDLECSNYVEKYPRSSVNSIRSRRYIDFVMDLDWSLSSQQIRPRNRSGSPTSRTTDSTDLWIQSGSITKSRSMSRLSHQHCFPVQKGSLGLHIG